MIVRAFLYLPFTLPQCVHSIETVVGSLLVRSESRLTTPSVPSQSVRKLSLHSRQQAKLKSGSSKTHHQTPHNICIVKILTREGEGGIRISLPLVKAPLSRIWSLNLQQSTNIWLSTPPITLPSLHPLRHRIYIMVNIRRPSRLFHI